MRPTDLQLLTGYVGSPDLHGWAALRHRWHSFWCDFHHQRVRLDDRWYPDPPDQRHLRRFEHHYGRCGAALRGARS